MSKVDDETAPYAPTWHHQPKEGARLTTPEIEAAKAAARFDEHSAKVRALVGKVVSTVWRHAQADCGKDPDEDGLTEEQAKAAERVAVDELLTYLGVAPARFDVGTVGHAGLGHLPCTTCGLMRGVCGGFHVTESPTDVALRSGPDETVSD